MHLKWVFKHFAPRLRSRILPMVALWTFSLLAGILLCALSSSDLVGLFRAACTASPAPAGRLLVCTLPIAVMAAALLSPLFVLSYLAVFLCGISHGFCGFAIYIAQGNAAWLLRPMLLFSAGCSSVLMWWLILQCQIRPRLHRNIRLSAVLSCVVYCIDSFVISPLIGDLSKYF